MNDYTADIHQGSELSSETSGLTFTGDVRVPAHSSAFLCKSVSSSIMETFSQCSTLVMGIVSSCCRPCGPSVVILISKFDILIGEGLHIPLKLWAEKQSKQNPWEDGNPHVFSEELWSLFFVAAIPTRCLKTYLGFHTAHFQAVKERLSTGYLTGAVILTV